MTIVCAWCRRILVAGGLPVSHGICPSCAEDFEIGAADLTANGAQAAPVLLGRTT